MFRASSPAYSAKQRDNCFAIENVAGDNSGSSPLGQPIPIKNHPVSFSKADADFDLSDFYAERPEEDEGEAPHLTARPGPDVIPRIEPDREFLAVQWKGNTTVCASEDQSINATQLAAAIGINRRAVLRPSADWLAAPSPKLQPRFRPPKPPPSCSPALDRPSHQPDIPTITATPITTASQPRP